jgi:phosphoglycolate phosphatase-like HAD superfamily hydrolase
MFKIISDWDGVILAKRKDLAQAITEAAEWAEYDDILVKVFDKQGNEVYCIDGYAEAVAELYEEVEEED